MTPHDGLLHRPKGKYNNNKTIRGWKREME
jgi:hypothetical protein